MNKVTLRALEPEDLELLYTIENDTEVWEVSSSRVNYSKFAIKKYLAEQPQEIAVAGEVRLAITDRDSKKAIGVIDLTNYSATNRSAEIGISLLKSERGKGYGQAAIKEIEQYAKAHLNMRMLYAYTSADSTSAGKNLFLACKYIPVATLPEWYFSNGEYIDLTIFKKNL